MKIGDLIDESVRIMSFTEYQNLAFAPILGFERTNNRVTLDCAIKTDEFVVEEIGRVNSLRINNHLSDEVFIASGMTFEGASQNRAAIYPAIIPAHTEIDRFPVHCVEQFQGLLGSGSRYKDSTTIVIASARSGVTAHEQEHTWSTINDTMTRLGAASHTQDYTSIQKAPKVDEYLSIFGQPQKDQVGYVAAVRKNGEVFFCLDLLGSPDMFSKLGNRFYRSVATLAATYASRNQGDSGKIGNVEKDVSTFLETAKRTEMKAVDRETYDSKLKGEVYISQAPVQGTALVHWGAPIQVSLRQN